jgi:hypothetical protein
MTLGSHGVSIRIVIDYRSVMTKSVIFAFCSIFFLQRPGPYVVESTRCAMPEGINKQHSKQQRAQHSKFKEQRNLSGNINLCEVDVGGITCH